MASTSSVLKPNPTGPQVFICFRGKDVRKNFISFLDHALREANIKVFIDEDELLGSELVNLLKRIEESEIAVVIFTEDFTSSYWCLDELAKIKERKDQGRLKVIPIFYKVQPSVVKYLRSTFGDNFRDLRRSHLHQPQRILKWEKALETIPESIGMPLADQSDTTDNDFITTMVIKIQRLLGHMAMRQNQEREVNCRGGPIVSATKPTINHKTKDLQYMAASSSDVKGPQVFINLGEEGLHKYFIGHLEDALKEAKINYFVGRHEQMDPKIQNQMIEQSRLALVIFSREYNTSRWCLDELAQINEFIDKDTLIAIPIFYRLETSVVRNLEGYFGDTFRKLKRYNQHDLVRTNKWKEAITSIADKVGIELTSHSTDKEFIKIIVDELKRLLDGIEMIDQKREEVNSQCSMIYARKIEITHSKNPENWTWTSIEESPNGLSVEIATMIEVYRMDIRGIFYTKKLTPKKKYELVFVVKLEETANGWDKLVNLDMKLVMRDKSEILQEKKIYLEDFIGDEWVDIKVGDFVAPPKNTSAKILFSMYQYDQTVRKTGLVVKGVAIRVVN